MLHRFIKQKEDLITREGGIKEQITAARLGYRNQQQATIDALRTRTDDLSAQIAALKIENERLREELKIYERQRQ